MEKYKIGDYVSGTVTGITNYGIFIKLEEGYTGLIHISEISSAFVRDVSDYAKVGDVISAKVLAYDEKMDKLKLSIKYAEDDKKKNTNREIVENGRGFDGLRESLDFWIDDKLKEIQQKEKIS